MGFDLGKIGVQKNIPKVNFTEYSGVFEAPEKFGKTAMASLFPKAILLAFEKGYKAQVINKKDINTWDDFVEFLDLLEEHREEIGNDIQTIVIDTVDEAYPLVEAYMCKKEGKKDGKKYTSKKEIAYGQGWGLHDLYFKEQIKRIYKLGFTPLYLTHSTIKTISPKEGQPYDVYQSTMPDRCKDIIFAEVDYIIHGQRVKVDNGLGDMVMKRALVVKGNNDSVAGNRVYFDEDILFDSEEEAMVKFQEKFEDRIKVTLEKAGIHEDIKKIAKKQAEEKAKEVKEYMAKSKLPTAEELVAIIKENFPKAIAEKQNKAKEIIKGNGIAGFDQLIDADISILQNIVEALR